MRVVEAIDVGPHQSHVVLAGDGDDFLLQGVFADLRETRRNQDRTGNLLRAAIGKHACDEGCRYAEDGDVDVTGDLGHARIAGVVEYRFGPGVDGIDGAFITAVNQVSHHGIADLALFGGCPDDRHGVGLHDAPHGVEYGVVPWSISRLCGRTELHVVVHGEDSVGTREHRIQVQLRDLGEIGNQPAHICDQRRQRVAIDRCGAAHALEDFGTGDIVEHR